MRPEGAGPAFVLYPPIDDDDDIASSNRVSTTSDRRPPDYAEDVDDDLASNVLRVESVIQEPASSTVPASVTTTTVGAISAVTVARGGGNKAKEQGVGGAVSATASASASCMSRDLAAKFDALKRRKANGDEVEARHVALAEEALGMASDEIARMERACAELEGRLGADGGGGRQPQPERHDGGRNRIDPGPEHDDRGGGRRRARQEEAGNDIDGFPILLPRVVVVMSSDQSSRDEMDHGGHEFDHLLDVQRSTQDEEQSELDDENFNDP